MLYFYRIYKIISRVHKSLHIKNYLTLIVLKLNILNINYFKLIFHNYSLFQYIHYDIGGLASKTFINGLTFYVPTICQGYDRGSRHIALLLEIGRKPRIIFLNRVFAPPEVNTLLISVKNEISSRTFNTRDALNKLLVYYS